MLPPYITVLFALIIGLITGLILQRGRVCFNSAFRNVLLIRNIDLALIVIIAVSVELIGYQILSFITISDFIFESSPLPFSILLLPIGSLLFGFGTVIAGGCAGGVCYRIGEGSIKSLLAFVGFAVGIGLLSIEPMSSFVIDLRDSTLWEIGGKAPSLELIMPRGFWTLCVIILLIAVIYFYKKHTVQLVHLRQFWTPIISGVLLGVVGTFARFLSTLSGRPFGFSTTDGIGEIFSYLFSFFGLLSPQQLGWAAFFVIGIIIGALFSSTQLKEFKIKIPSKSDTIRFFGGGIILGMGAFLASGCNFGHILGGIPELGLSSVFAAFLMLFGNWIGSHIFYNLMKQEIPESTPMLINVN